MTNFVEQDNLDIPTFLDRRGDDASAVPARPLPELAKLIRDDLAKADKAAKAAGMPWYIAAGTKLLEAKAQLEHGGFGDWIKRNFSLSARTAREYMALAKAENGSALPKWESLREFRRESRPSSPPAGFARLREDAKRREEKCARFKRLGLRLVSVGYRELAKELHPDAGGNDEQMALLNEVKLRLERFC